MPELPTSCLRCGSEALRKTRTSTSRTYGFDFLPGLGFLTSGTLYLVLCIDCGKLEIFSDDFSRKKIAESGKWQDINKTM